MNEYELAIFVAGMEFPEIGKVTIQAETVEDAKQWVLDHLTLEESDAPNQAQH